MRLISYGQPGRERPGLLIEQKVVPLEELDPGATSVRVALAENRLPLIRGKLAAWTGKSLPLSMLRLGPPLPDARKIICIGLNYRGHAIEQKKPWPKQPLLFAKTTNTLTGPLEDVAVPAGCRGDYEVELAVVIGRRTQAVPPSEALAAIGGYMVANDITARRWQHEDGQWYRAKSCDGFFPCGPCLVTPDEVPDPMALRLTTTISGEVLQDALLSDLIHPLEQLIAYISRTITLEPGDIISTGTPAGVGAFRSPPRALCEGEVVECAISGLGVLRNRITILPGPEA